MPDSSAPALDLFNDFKAQHPNLRYLDAFFADLSGVVRGKRLPVSDGNKVFSGDFAMPASCFLLDTSGTSRDPLGYGFSDGDPDTFARALPYTLAPVPWSDGRAAQVMVTFERQDGSPLEFEPRTILKRAIDRLASLGLKPTVAFELEFYLLDRERLPGKAPQPPVSPVSGLRDSSTQVYGMDQLDNFAELLEDISAFCAAQGVRTGAITTEYAPGQYEINLHHVDDALKAADQCVMFKRSVKAAARKHGVQATFMAKPYLEQAGSGQHIHVSLSDESGRNVFDGGDELMSDSLRHAVGGVLDLMPDSMAFAAPNLNSFRRFQPNIFVPISRSWSFENRSTALRIPISDGANRRIEHRLAGADANPYLLLAALLAGIYHGITKKIDCGPVSEGNAGEDYDPALPMRPRRALERLKASEALGEILGQDYLALYCATKETEYDAFESQMTSLEYDWYLLAD